MEEAVKILKENGIRVVKVHERRNNIQIARIDSDKYISLQDKLNISKEITVCWLA